MRPELANFLATLIGYKTPKQAAYDTLIYAAQLGEQNHPDWWKWTVWLWCALGIERIQKIGQ